ncbi:MAG TPA: c-type cytochrome [Acidimicrobiales bacterium]|nr:c-type cytochrome [Acidimicrobiales bacterium]
MRSKIRTRYLLPGFVVLGVALVGLVTAGSSAGADTAPAAGQVANSGIAPLIDQASPSITYHLPPASYAPAGNVLFQANCASCHGSDALGTDRAPNLVGLGAATVDFWVSTGRMPLADTSQQAVRKPVRFTHKQILQIVAYVSSLAPPAISGPAIPIVHLQYGNMSNGNSLFVLNCASCHTITGAGDALADGFFAPSLHKATSTQIAEAVRTGPGNMPRFSTGALSDAQVTDIVSYVKTTIQHPDNAGGLALGGIGPVAEGFIALLLGVGICMLLAFWIGERSESETSHD